MKKIIFIQLAFVILFSLTQCKTRYKTVSVSVPYIPTSEKICSDPETRGKIISTLINNDTYMNQVMDSIRTKHPDVILTALTAIMKEDKAMQKKMMGTMMNLCTTDSSMCKMMMQKTMDMCDEDQSKCSMMSDMIKHKPMMKCMMNMMMEKGMIEKEIMKKGMKKKEVKKKGTKSNKEKPKKNLKTEDHLKHH